MFTTVSDRVVDGKDLIRADRMSTRGWSWRAKRLTGFVNRAKLKVDVTDANNDGECVLTILLPNFCTAEVRNSSGRLVAQFQAVDLDRANVVVKPGMYRIRFYQSVLAE